MPFLVALSLIFITLKLTEVITWSWWLVLLPLYGGTVAFLVIFGVALCLEAYRG